MQYIQWTPTHQPTMNVPWTSDALRMNIGWYRDECVTNREPCLPSFELREHFSPKQSFTIMAALERNSFALNLISWLLYICRANEVAQRLRGRTENIFEYDGWSCGKFFSLILQEFILVWHFWTSLCDLFWFDRNRFWCFWERVFSRNANRKLSVFVADWEFYQKFRDRVVRVLAFVSLSLAWARLGTLWAAAVAWLNAIDVSRIYFDAVLQIVFSKDRRNPRR